MDIEQCRCLYCFSSVWDTYQSGPRLISGYNLRNSLNSCPNSKVMANDSILFHNSGKFFKCYLNVFVNTGEVLGIMTYFLLLLINYNMYYNFILYAELGFENLY